MDKYLMWLDQVSGLGCESKMKLVNYFGNGEIIFNAKEEELKQVLKGKKLENIKKAQKGDSINELEEEVRKNQIQFFSIYDTYYPEKLRNIPDKPFALYVKGKLPMESKLSVAIIGARECSEYGKYVAKETGKILAETGIQVISGMARGIDGISQKAALDSGGDSYGILGCGVDICYPKSNQQLYDMLSNQGGLISTYPMKTQPKPGLFPPRNRIVSGLSDIVVVIEAREKSGTLITVDMALEQGRDVYAMPGRITDRLSDGCNRLIKQGAEIFLSPNEFLKELDDRYLIEKTKNKVYNSNDIEKEKIENSILKSQILLYEYIDFYPKSIDEIKNHYHNNGKNITYDQLWMELMELCLENIIIQKSPGWFVRNC